MKLRSTTGTSALKLPTIDYALDPSKRPGCLLCARQLPGAEIRQWSGTWPLPLASLESSGKDLWLRISSNSCWNTKIHLHLVFLIHKAPNNCQKNPLLCLLQNIPFSLWPRFPWLQFTCDSHNICLILKFIWQFFWNPRDFFNFFPLPSNTKKMEKLISCVKIRDDRRSKVKPIYKGNCCQCLEKSVFIWKTQWSTWPLVSHSISLRKSFNPRTAMGRKTVRICISTTCSELLANRLSICSLNSHPGKLPIFPLGLSEKITPQSLPNHPYLPGFFSSLNAAGMNSSGPPSLLAGSLKLTFQTQLLPWREGRRVESSPQSDNN